MKIILLSITLCIQLAVFGQTVVPAQNITSDAGEFMSLTPVTNLGLNINTATTSATTFPYAPGQFFDDIGYVSWSGTTSGTLTFTFASPASISEIMIWNAYFDYELDHSIQNAQLVFKDDLGATITTENITPPIATAMDLLPYVATFTPVMGVKEIDIVVSALWGGTEISMRRVAFAGNTFSIEEEELPIAVTMDLLVYPNPTINSVTIPLSDITALNMIDLTGRMVETNLTVLGGSSQLSWNRVESGVYLIQVSTENGEYSSRIQVVSAL